MKGVENGVGVLVPSLQCPRCMKYDYTGRETGTGPHPASKEICYEWNYSKAHVLERKT